MMTAPIPANEAERIQALRELLILDTPPEERFDRIVEFAAEEFGVPIALISLVDDDRQWFKARFGLAVCETDRRSSFCGHAIHVSEVMVVSDATQDSRFADNPMVLGPPHIRFYAGALRCPPSTPVALTAEACDLPTAQLYKELQVRRIMLKPFKVKTALEVIQDLARPESAQ